ncbi:MAG: hypothetical protein ACREAG_00745 [Nitrosopumilaceae archaeon]
MQETEVVTASNAMQDVGRLLVFTFDATSKPAILPRERILGEALGYHMSPPGRRWVPNYFVTNRGSRG